MIEPLAIKASRLMASNKYTANVAMMIPARNIGKEI